MRRVSSLGSIHGRAPLGVVGENSASPPGLDQQHSSSRGYPFSGYDIEIWGDFHLYGDGLWLVFVEFTSTSTVFAWT
jgi:hypothetical protein